MAWRRVPVHAVDMDEDDIQALQVTVALQALQIDALRAALGWRAAAEVERQLVERISRMPMAPAVDEAAASWAAAVLWGSERA